MVLVRKHVSSQMFRNKQTSLGADEQFISANSNKEIFADSAKKSFVDSAENPMQQNITGKKKQKKTTAPPKGWRNSAMKGFNWAEAAQVRMVLTTFSHRKKSP